jgi:two-component system OmpR family response regulator
VPSLNVLLVEDSKVLTERLTEAIQQLDAVRIIGTVDTEAAAVAIAQLESVDIILLDLHLNQGTGFGVRRRLNALHLKPCIIVLTNYDLPEYKEAAVSLGTTFFLDKARDFDRLPKLLELCEGHHGNH